MAPSVVLRPAELHDVEDVALLWAEGWRAAHDGFVSPQLSAARGAATFLARTAARLASTLVAVNEVAVVGFAMVIGDEVEQLYVARAWRGAGVAAQLLAAAEELVARRGFGKAWLAVIPENHRARRFYEKRGWTDEGAFDYGAEGPAGDIAVPCRRYTKVVPSYGRDPRTPFQTDDVRRF